MRIYLLLLLAVLCANSSDSLAQNDKKDPSRWTPEDIISRESMSSVSLSPNNQMVLWTKRKMDKKKDRFVFDIYLTRLDIKKDGKFKTIQLTNGSESDYNPIFSKDGEFVYFLSSRDKGNKLWRLSIYGGEAEKVREFKEGISGLQWQNENTLLFRSSDGKTLYEKELSDKKDNVLVVEDSSHWRPNHVYAFNLKDKSVKRVTNNAKPLGFSVVSPDGKWVAYSMQRSRSYASDGQKDPYYYLQDLTTGDVTKIITDRAYPIGSVQFTNDSQGFYFSSEFGSDPQWNGAGINKLFYFEIASKGYREVDLKWALGMGGGFTVVGNDVIVALANKTNFKMTYFKRKGRKWTKLPVDFGEKNNHVAIHSIAKDGSKILYNHSTITALPKFYVADLKANKLSGEQEVIKLNAGLVKKPITKAEVITWKGFKGEEVTGLLYYPENYEAGKKYPLMLSIHGGPSSMDLDQWSERWSTYPNLLAQKGMFVLKPNYHGSANHGLSYVESIKGNYYEPELEDITAAIELLDQQGKIDKNKLGTMGWSNGAIITTMLTVRYPDLFKVAAAGAGDVNWTSDYGTCGFGVQFDQSYFIGAPWDDVNGKTYNENYITKSPLFELEKVKTPTIIFHGSEDRAVPRDQGWEYYRALQQVGQAPVKFLWFPGQPHGLRKITHQLRKMKEEISWIEKYLLEEGSEVNESFKKDSPLAAMLELQKVKMSDGLYGEMKNGLLIPETVQVKEDSIAIGCFEVTNAQFGAFKSDWSYTAGLENYPVQVSRQEAEAYLSWLSKRTGETYRLPNETEGKKLHKMAGKAAKNGNTLNYWAGYTLTKEDVTGLQTKMKHLQLSLVEKVGSRKSWKIGKAKVYNLGGNVAEHFQKGVYGYSAYDFYDVNNDEMISSEHVGFRVIKE